MRVVPTCLIVALTALIWSPYDIDQPLPGGSFHRSTRGGPRLELSDLPLHDVELGALPGAEHGDSLDSLARAARRRGDAGSQPALLAQISGFSSDLTAAGELPVSPESDLLPSLFQPTRNRAPPAR
jgi:hypothetical protein